MRKAEKKAIPNLSAKFIPLLQEPYRGLLNRWAGTAEPLPASMAAPLADPALDAVILVVRGNAHAMFSIANHPEPFDFLMPGEDDTPQADRRIVSYGLVSRSIERLMQTQLDIQEGFFKAAERPVHLLIPPPPFPDERVRAQPGPFEDKIKELDVAPLRFRVKCWQVQRAISKRWAAERNMPVIDVPAQLIAANGSLRRHYCGKKDPTHGNPRYGLEIFEAIRQSVEQVKAAA